MVMMFGRKWGFRYVAPAIILFFSGCIKEPSYSDVPEIKFSSVWHRAPSGITANDTVYVEFSFKDGDGDLGLSQADTIPPYQPSRNGEVNENHYNILVDYYIRTSATAPWRLYVGRTSPISSNGRFGLLRPNGTGGPMEGTIRYAIKSGSLPANVDSKVELFIKDRKLHNSNTIATPVFRIPPR